MSWQWRRPPCAGPSPQSQLSHGARPPKQPRCAAPGLALPPPAQQQQGGGGGGGGEVLPSGALARVEDEARQCDIELDDAFQGLAVSVRS